MKKNWIGYSLLIAGLLSLLVLYNKPFFLWAVLVLALLALMFFFLVRIDAEKIAMDLKVSTGARQNTKLNMILEVRSKRRLVASGGIVVRVKIHNVMWDQIKYREIELKLVSGENRFEVPLQACRCGELHISCEKAWILDLLNLYKIPVTGFREKIVTIYPHRANIRADVSGLTIGAPKADSTMQNRKGNDPSEIFDVREYVPGDDVRYIHWKLSSKTESLILKQTSDPSNYNIVILPDFGQKRNGEALKTEEINRILSIGMSIGEQLVQQEVEFHMAIPTEQGLQLFEIRSISMFRAFLPQWFGMKVQEETGGGLQYFLVEHMDQYFSRMLILSAGTYGQNLSVLENRIGAMLIVASEETKKMNNGRNGNCEIIKIPVQAEQEETYWIKC